MQPVLNQTTAMGTLASVRITMEEALPGAERLAAQGVQGTCHAQLNDRWDKQKNLLQFSCDSEETWHP
jgi:hypothetical protein